MPTFARLRLGGALGAAACLLSLCSFPSRASAQVQIFVEDCRFTNSSVANTATNPCTTLSGTIGPANNTTIQAGQSIDFVWNGTAQLHSAASASAGPSFNFDCGGVFCSGSFTTTSVGPYTVPGDYAYQCNFHGPPMSGTIHVTSAPASSLIVSLSPGSITAGGFVTVTVTAFDAFGNQDTLDNDPLFFFTTDNGTGRSAGVSLSGGFAQFSAQLFTAETQTVHVEDSGGRTFVGYTNSGNSVLVTPAATSKFAVSASPTTITAGSTTSLTVTAEDQFNNVSTDGFSGPLTFTGTDAQAVYPSGATISGGSGSGYSVTLKTAGSQTVTVHSGGVSGTSNGVTVNPAAGATFKVTGPVSSPSGSPFTVTVQAVDGFGNNTTIYSGTVHITTSDSSNTLPADAPLSSGTGIFTVTLNTAGPETVTATDTVTSSITGFATVNISPVCSAAPKTFSNSALIAINDVSPATPYPSPITVSMPGQQVAKITVTLHGFNHSFPSDIDVLLVGPGNQQLVLMSDSVQNGIPKTPVDLVFDDAAAMAIPQTAPSLAGGTYLPTAYSNFRTPTFNPTAPAGPWPTPAPEGTATLASIFKGIDPNGTWSLYIQDNVGGDFGQVDGGWSLTITPEQTFPNASAIALGTGTPPPGGSPGKANPYPSPIAVSGLPGNVSKVTVTLNSLTSSCPAGLGLMLEKFQGPSMVVMSLATSCTNVSGVTFTLDDAASAILPLPGTTLASGTFRPASYSEHFFSAPPSFLAPAPGSPQLATSDGSATLASVFNGIDPNGTWNLYVAEQTQFGAPADSGQFAGGWSLTIQTDCPADTICNIAPDANPSVFGNSVTFTANVTAPGGGTPNGKVDFVEGVVSLTGNNPIALDGSGSAQFSTSSLSGGSHNIQASYLGNTTYAVSVSAAPSQVVDPAPTTTVIMTSGSPSNAGSPVTFTATVTSGAGGPGGQIQFKNGAANLGAPVTLVAGVATSPAISNLPAGTLTIKAVYTDTIDGDFATSTGTVTQVVIPGPATHFTITGAPASATAGTAFGFNVQARDQFGNVATSYAGTVHFTSSDPHPATLPVNQTLTSGAKAFTATLFIVPSQTITVTDTVDVSLTPATVNLPVVPGATAKFILSSTASSPAGSAFSVTVTAKDLYGNATPGYGGIVHFTSTDPHPATLPANSTLVSGVKTFAGVILFTAPTETITATDTVTASITGSTNVTVTPLAATHLQVTTPNPVIAGTAFNATVTAQDQYNNTATAYAGTVKITSSDAKATLPANSTLASGVKVFSVTLGTTGSQSVTATDTVTASITGTAFTTVNPGGATHYIFLALPASVTAGSSFAFRLTAKDANGNTALTYGGTVHFTSTDPNPATLPASTTLTNGTAIFNATLFTTASQTITATDTVTASITASASEPVNPAATSKIAIIAPTPVTAGVAFNITVKAEDAFGNVTPSYAGTVGFTSTDPLATMPANGTLTNGVGILGAKLQTVGSKTITGTDTVTSSITGTSNAITVSKGSTTVSLASTFNPLYFRHRGNIVATVHVTGGAGKTTGTVQFNNGAVNLGGPIAVVNGTATLSGNALRFGSYSITAVYSGDANYNISPASPALALKVEPAPRPVP